MASQHEQTRGRGRSPSVRVKNRSVSPSIPPHPPYQDTTSGLGLELPGTTSFSTASFSASNSVTSGPETFGFTAPYLTSSQASHTSPAIEGYAQNQQYSQSFEASFVDQLEQSSSHASLQRDDNYSDFLRANQSDLDFNLYADRAAGDFDSLLLDPQAQPPSQPASQSVNPADLISRMSSPLLLPPERHPSGSPPSSTPGTFYTPQHSRHSSLEPTRPTYVTGQPQLDWQGLLGNPSFHGHRRAPSEHSDVSSAAHSPYMAQFESLDGGDGHQSPLLAPQDDSSLYEHLAMDSVTISGQQCQGFSPGQSPYLSPQLMPQQGGDLGSEYLAAQQALGQTASVTADMYPTSGEGQAMNIQAPTLTAEIGQASQMVPPPSINVEFAPPSKNQNFDPSEEADFDALSPPRIPNPRGRSKSDPFGRPVSRPKSPSASGSLEPATHTRSLSPFDPLGQQHSSPSSRDSSPSKSARRQSTSSIDSRNFILDLADPQRPGAAPGDSKRVQKHPATFQCSLCPKRFTRAYNLRSHLRTHTDERPFVCTVCGKAFARQHDRKRHEGLHSGEKKFICRGDLVRGGNWGCGRRFARADALGRHFRSEAGRACIKPLLDEENNDRVYMEQQQKAIGHLQPVPQPIMMSSIDGQPTGFTLPAAILAQYPALQTIQWDQLPSTSEDPNDISGRSSFDASSGGEFGYDDDDSGLNGRYGAGPGSLFTVNDRNPIFSGTGDEGYGCAEWSSDGR